MNVLVKDINVLLMLRIHTNYYIVCLVISFLHTTSPGKYNTQWVLIMPDFNKLFSQSGLKMKQLKVCIVSWSVTLARAVIKPGPALGGRLVLGPQSQPRPGSSLSQYQAVTWQPDTLLKTWHSQTFHKIRGNWKFLPSSDDTKTEEVKLYTRRYPYFCLDLRKITSYLIHFKMFDWWWDGMSK